MCSSVATNSGRGQELKAIVATVGGRGGVQETPVFTASPVVLVRISGYRYRIPLITDKEKSLVGRICEKGGKIPGYREP